MLTLSLLGAVVAVVAGIVAGHQPRDPRLRGKRFRPLAWEEMSAAQQAMANEVIDSKRGDMSGPFNVFLRSPDIGNLAQRLGEQVRFHSSLPPRLNEMAILMTARWWSSQFEWYAHQPLALEAGLSPDVVDALHAGTRPAAMQADEAIVYDFSTELRDRRRVSDTTFAAAVSAFGERGVMDLIAVMGYYDIVSMALNVDGYPLPDGAASPFAEPTW